MHHHLGLPDGAYDWRYKGRKGLATGGTITLSGGTTHQELGLQRAGDANNDNAANTIDFVILRNTFGKSFGDQGYDERGDFNNDSMVNVTDFTLLRNNFGTSGAALSCPTWTMDDGRWTMR